MIDMPPELLPENERVIEQRLVECGLRADGFSVRYEEILQGVEIVISSSADASKDDLDCIRNAAGLEFVRFEDGELQAAYEERIYELARPQLLQAAEEGLKKRGLLEGFPQRADFGSDKQFAEALEQHCGVKAGSFIVESEWGLVFRPGDGSVLPNDSGWEHMACVLSAVQYASLKGQEFSLGLIGNEKFRDGEGG